MSIIKTISKKFISKIADAGAIFLRAIGADVFLIATINNSKEWETAVKDYYQKEEEHRRAHILDRRF